MIQVVAIAAKAAAGGLASKRSGVDWTDSWCYCQWPICLPTLDHPYLKPSFGDEVAERLHSSHVAVWNRSNQYAFVNVYLACVEPLLLCVGISEYLFRNSNVYGADCNIFIFYPQRSNINLQLKFKLISRLKLVALTQVVCLILCKMVQ